MTKSEAIESPVVENAVLVGVQLPGQKTWEVEYSLRELGQLADTAGALVVASVIQVKEKPHPRTFIGTGKADEIKDLLDGAANGLVIFDDELTPSQQLNLEEIIDHKVIDRTGLILDIFAQHAHTAEGKIQVELAQLNYYLPRLKGLGIDMSRLGGGIGTRGPGETKLETDRRRLRQRIQQLNAELLHLGKVKELQRHKRQMSGVFGISLVGYTNTGKSSLLNKMTNADVLVEDKLFATLDSTSRKLEMPGGKSVVLSDTVGFINKLPHQLVAAFKSTLQEAKQARLLLHVIDASNPHMDKQVNAVNRILDEIGIQDTPQISIYNKIDLIDEDSRNSLGKEPNSLAVSTLSGEGMENIFELIDQLMAREFEVVELRIPYDKGAVRQKIFDLGVVISERSDQQYSTVLAELKPQDIKRFAAYIRKRSPDEIEK